MDGCGNPMEALFHSEITSSYMLSEVLREHPAIASAMIEKWFNIPAEAIEVKREHQCQKVGAVDVFLKFVSEGKTCALPIEVKVHDYTSARDGQINLYYDALNQCGEYSAVYFIYLTQFNSQAEGDVARPKTLDEAQRGRIHIGKGFAHISWAEMHSFLDPYQHQFTEEQSLILKLNKIYLEKKCAEDIKNYGIKVGTRGLEHYFPDIKIDLKERFPFGCKDSESKKEIWRIDLRELDNEQLMDVYEVIKTYAESQAVDKIKQYPTENLTLDAASTFLQELSKQPDEWRLIPFYVKLFTLAKDEPYLKFNGTGSVGFSIIVSTKNAGSCSLCRIHKNRKIDFSLLR